MDRQMLARATEGTEAPTPGYLYGDLAKRCASNPSACSETAQYLTRRLANKNNVNIKFKCLKVIQKLCEQVPRNAFSRCVSQDPQAVGAIKEAIGFRGPLDPVQGDTQNERVRTAARECLDAVYTERSTSEPSMSASYGAPVGHQQQQNFSGAGGAYNGQPSRMQGIGNPMYANQPPAGHHQQGPGGMGVLKEAGGVIVGMIRDPLARNLDAGGQQNVPRQGHSDLPGYNRPQYGRPPPGQQELSRQTNGQWNMATNRGPTAIQNEEYYKASQQQSYNWASNQNGSGAGVSGQVGGSWASASAAPPPSLGQPAPPPAAPGAYGQPAPAPVAPAPSDGSYERQLIQELCPPGGMKPVPPPDKLENFRRSAASLNADLVCPVLLDFIEDGQPWVIRAKALGVMQVAVEQSPGCRSFLHTNVEEIAPLTSHARPAIRDPAKRVLQLLGVDTAGIPQAAAPMAAAPQADLLGFDQPAAPAPAAVQAPAPVAPSNDMFGGMQVKSKPAAAPPVAAPPVAAPAPSLLDFDAPALPPAAPPPSDTFAPTSSIATNSAPIDMFGGMTIKGEGTKPAEEVAAAPSGSAFGFINNDSPAEAASASLATPEVAAAPHAKLTPNTQRKMMQLSPEQLQAMAVQQANMQQAQQMQLLMHQQQMMNMNPLLQQQVLLQQQQQMMRMNATGGPRLTLNSNSSSSRSQPPMQNPHEKKFDFVKDFKDAMK